MKISKLFLLVLACISAPAFAADPVVKAVYGSGTVELSQANAEEQAKVLAAQDAVKKCGSSPVELAENLGWKIQNEDMGPPCRPHHFCEQLPDEVTATALFICVANLSHAQ